MSSGTPVTAQLVAEMVALRADGATLEEIAYDLGVSRNTVQRHTGPVEPDPEHFDEPAAA